MKQVEPTIIWQDNQAAIQIARNRGSLAKKTRAMELRVMTVRNKVEDMKAVPIYLRTSEMVADGPKPSNRSSSPTSEQNSAGIGKGRDNSLSHSLSTTSGLRDLAEAHCT